MQKPTTGTPVHDDTGTTIASTPLKTAGITGLKDTAAAPTNTGLLA